MNCKSSRCIRQIAYTTQISRFSTGSMSQNHRDNAMIGSQVISYFVLFLSAAWFGQHLSIIIIDVRGYNRDHHAPSAIQLLEKDARARAQGRCNRGSPQLPHRHEEVQY